MEPHSLRSLWPEQSWLFPIYRHLTVVEGIKRATPIDLNAHILYEERPVRDGDFGRLREPEMRVYLVSGAVLYPAEIFFSEKIGDALVRLARANELHADLGYVERMVIGFTPSPTLPYPRLLALLGPDGRPIGPLLMARLHAA